MQRLRSNHQLRRLVRENELSINDLVLPLFVCNGKGIKNSISSMPGHYQLSIDNLKQEIKEISDLQIPAIILFGIPKTKDSMASDSYNKRGIIQTAICEIKNINPNLLVISDLCFCQYTDHGHCCILKDKEIDYVKSLELLAKQALSHVKAGADVVAPSCMLDGMVRSIRQALDNGSFQNIPILSYAAKYASSLYSPFREAAQGAPKFGDRNKQQIDIANSNEALLEANININEGADIIMVKPASQYLDILFRIKQSNPTIPVAAYSVSGEFAMIKAATEKGFLEEKPVVMETLTSIKRAGASFIINYFCKDVAKWLT